MMAEEPSNESLKPTTDNILKHGSYQGFKIKPDVGYLASSKIVLFNSDVYISLAAPLKVLGGNEFYKNADSDEVIFVDEGTGVLKAQYGQLKFGYGDYL